MLLAKPLTFMNLSGRAVAGLAGFYKIEPADVLVVTDDVALPLGRLRARREGSAGGHNGLKSIIAVTSERRRFRRDTGRGRDAATMRRDLADHVLGRFRRRRARHGFGGGAAGRRCVGDVSLRAVSSA